MILAGISDLVGQAVTRENSTLDASAPPSLSPNVAVSNSGQFARIGPRQSHAVAAMVRLAQSACAHVERIEVLRGPQSGRYGSDTIGK
jgi:outer membrane receptor protein involved in Fe transport